MSCMVTRSLRRSGKPSRWRVGHLFDSCWRTAQRNRRLMSGAVHGAEQAVGRAREDGAPLGDLPVLMQKLRAVSAEVDRFMLVQACTGAHQQSFERAIRLAADVIAASIRIDYAASSAVDGPCNPRARSIAASAALEACSILDDLAMTLMNDPEPAGRPQAMVR
jgi:hypothetical protein